LLFAIRHWGLVINWQWENGFPLVLYADDGPAFGVGDLSTFVRTE
jgi:hypothetical protein